MTMQKSIHPTILSRPPIVTVLGHVDHGKTTLLDTIRKTDVASKEFGGITQHIGAYQIEFPHKSGKIHTLRKITFVDTPGHEAFAQMRSRGASVADIAILVVAGNDGVKPQTMESIDHIKNAKIPCIVAINKIDLPDINLDKIKKHLVKAGLNLEEYGGEVPVIPISAKNNKNIDKLIEAVFLLADLYEIGEKTPGVLKGLVIESFVSKNQGPLASVIIESGELKAQDTVCCESQEFKVRSLIDQNGKQVSGTVSSGTPVRIMGWKTAPKIGSALTSKSQNSDFGINYGKTVLSAGFGKKVVPETGKEGETKKVRVILKADTNGSLEAILNGFSEDVEIISAHAGMITESDVFLAKTTGAIIIGFNIKPSDSAAKLAEAEKVILKTYNIIYELFDEIKDVADALLKGNLVNILGEAKILQLFPYDDETVAGVKVLSGRLARGDLVKIMNEDTEIGRTRIKSLKYFKEDVNRVEKGKEAGVLLSGKIDLLTGYSIISIG